MTSASFPCRGIHEKTDAIEVVSIRIGDAADVEAFPELGHVSDRGLQEDTYHPNGRVENVSLSPHMHVSVV